MSATDKTLEGEHHCVHVVGIGRTGAVYVEALLRTGDVEDNLAHEGTTFASLIVDVGDDDIEIANDYARSFGPRLASRKLPADKHHHESVVLAVPDTAGFARDLDAVRPLYAGDGELLTGLPRSFEMPKAGEHLPRAIAKAVAAFGLHLNDKPLAGALQRFADQVKRANCRSTVLVAFGLAGGTGSGMAFAVARELQRLDLGDTVRIVGVGQLSHSGDGDYHDSVAQTMSIAEIDRAVSGPASASPFPGGCFIVSSEHSWQRLSAYTSTGVREVRQRFKQLVTNRFVADSFMRWAVSDNSEHFDRILSASPGKCIMLNVAKISHPGVQVLPGQPRSTWDAVLQQWIGFVPDFAGLRDGFKTDHVEAHIFTARDMRSDMIEKEFKELIVSRYMNNGSGSCLTFCGEFFDELTAYANIVLPGVGKDDLTAYSQTGADSGSALERT